MEGWLNKKKSKDNKALALFSGDNKRWFKVIEVRGMEHKELAFCYFKNQKEKEAKGWIYLKDITEIYDDEVKSFTVVSPSRTVTVSANSLAEHKMWLRGLCLLCPWAKSSRITSTSTFLLFNIFCVDNYMHMQLTWGQVSRRSRRRHKSWRRNRRPPQLEPTPPTISSTRSTSDCSTRDRERRRAILLQHLNSTSSSSSPIQSNHRGQTSAAAVGREMTTTTNTDWATARTTTPMMRTKIITTAAITTEEAAETSETVQVCTEPARPGQQRRGSSIECSCE
jgi:hypothetical protein